MKMKNFLEIAYICLRYLLFFNLCFLMIAFLFAASYFSLLKLIIAFTANLIISYLLIKDVQ